MVVIYKKSNGMYLGNYSKTLRAYAERDNIKQAKKFKNEAKASLFLTRVTGKKFLYKEYGCKEIGE